MSSQPIWLKMMRILHNTYWPFSFHAQHVIICYIYKASYKIHPQSKMHIWLYPGSVHYCIEYLLSNNLLHFFIFKFVFNIETSFSTRVIIFHANEIKIKLNPGWNQYLWTLQTWNFILSAQQFLRFAFTCTTSATLVHINLHKQMMWKTMYLPCRRPTTLHSTHHLFFFNV